MDGAPPWNGTLMILPPLTSSTCSGMNSDELPEVDANLELARLLLGVGRKILERLVLERAVAAHEPCHGVVVDEGDRLQALVIEFALRAPEAVAPVQAGDDADRVAVVGCLHRQERVADHAAAARLVRDDDLVTGPFLQVLGENASRDVHAAAGWIDHDQLQRVAWKVLRLQGLQLGLDVGLALRDRGRQRQNSEHTASSIAIKRASFMFASSRCFRCRGFV